MTRPTDKSVDIVEGYGLVGYCSWLVDTKSIEAFSQLCKQCFTSDDLTISFALAVHQVPRIAIDVDKASPDVTALSYGFASDALHKNQEHSNAYATCAKAIETFLSQHPK